MSGERRSLAGRGPIAAELSRRELLERGAGLGLGGLVLSALPVADRIARPAPAQAAALPDEGMLQAFADTVIPGRRVRRTDLGDEVHPQAIAGVDPEPGAVEADALRIYQDPLLGFPAIEWPFLTDLNLRALSQGGDFLSLSYERRVEVVRAGLDFSNPDRVMWEAAASVAFVAFCAAGAQHEATDRTASGLRVMGFPGAAPNGYRDFSYRRALSRERTRAGSLP